MYCIALPLSTKYQRVSSNKVESRFLFFLILPWYLTVSSSGFLPYCAVMHSNETWQTDPNEIVISYFETDFFGSKTILGQTTPDDYLDRFVRVVITPQ